MTQVKSTAPLYIFMSRKTDFSLEGYPKVWRPEGWPIKIAEDADTIFLEERKVEVDVANFDPVPKQVAALEAAKAKAYLECEKLVASINQQLSQLLAIENNPTQEV